MTTLHCRPTLRTPARTRKMPNRDHVPPTAVPPERVREMLREIAFVLHATRVVRRMGEGVDGGPA